MPPSGNHSGMSDPRLAVPWVSQALELERTRDEFTAALLDAAIELTHAERGYLVLVEEPGDPARRRLRVDVARGYDRQSLEAPEGKMSRTVVARVLERGRGLCTASEEDRDVTQITSVRKNRVVSILCVPLRVDGVTRGVIYLDHRFIPDAFTLDHLALLEGVAVEAARSLARYAP